MSNDKDPIADLFRQITDEAVANSFGSLSPVGMVEGEMLPMGLMEPTPSMRRMPGGLILPSTRMEEARQRFTIEDTPIHCTELGSWPIHWTELGSWRPVTMVDGKIKGGEPNTALPLVVGMPPYGGEHLIQHAQGWTIDPRHTFVRLCRFSELLALPNRKNARELASVWDFLRTGVGGAKAIADLTTATAGDDPMIDRLARLASPSMGGVHLVTTGWGRRPSFLREALGLRFEIMLMAEHERLEAPPEMAELFFDYTGGRAVLRDWAISQGKKHLADLIRLEDGPEEIRITREQAGVVNPFRETLFAAELLRRMEGDRQPWDHIGIDGDYP